MKARNELRKPALDLSDVVRQQCTLITGALQWTVAGFDWQRRSAADIAGAVLRHARAGSIILLHDGATTARRDRRETILALPAIIEGLTARGLRFSSLPRLLQLDDTTAGSPTHV